MKYLLVILLAFVAGTPAYGHVGSPDVFYEGNAGPYRLFVTVRVPQVIPGIAEVDIRSESNDVSSVTIAPMQLTGPGSQFAPAPDLTQRSKADPQTFTGSIWLMESGSLQVRLGADGSRGKGSLAVPVPAIAQRTLPMEKPLGVLLFAVMLVLSLALVSIAAAAVREGSLAPGATTDPGGQRRNAKAIAIATVVIAAVLYAGWRWWDAVARVYARNVYTPPEIRATVDSSGRLLLSGKLSQIAAGRSRRAAELATFDHLIPDHDHLMHLFLIRTPGIDSFWHLHPEPSGHGQFSVNLPAIPAGHYKLFADVVMNSGFPVTMVGDIDISSLSGRPLSGDDSSAVASPIGQAADTTMSPLPDGGRMVWERDAEPLKHDSPLSFRFRVENSEGKPVHDLEPYMGMVAHAEIIRSDGSVFAHVHPAGSVSMAALDLAQAELPSGPQISGANAIAGTNMNMPGMPATSGDSEDSGPEVSFPYGFPQSGLYRIFVQIKRAGRIETGVFDVHVE